MKKKAVFLMGMVIALLVCIGVYFKPLALSDTVSKNSQISLILNEFEIRNGEPHIGSTELQDMTPEQKAALFALLEDFSYRRNPGTPFSDGSTSELGDKLLSIHVLDDQSSTDLITVTSAGSVSVNNKRYSMKGAEALIDQISNIMEQSDVREDVTEYQFHATVLEATDTYLLVEPTADSSERNCSDKIRIVIAQAHSWPMPQVGDLVNVVYDGWIQETYPAQIPAPFRVEILSE